MQRRELLKLSALTPLIGLPSTNAEPLTLLAPANTTIQLGAPVEIVNGMGRFLIDRRANMKHFQAWFRYPYQRVEVEHPVEVTRTGDEIRISYTRLKSTGVPGTPDHVLEFTEHIWPNPIIDELHEGWVHTDPINHLEYDGPNPHVTSTTMLARIGDTREGIFDLGPHNDASIAVLTKARPKWPVMCFGPHTLNSWKAFTGRVHEHERLLPREWEWTYNEKSKRLKRSLIEAAALTMGFDAEWAKSLCPRPWSFVLAVCSSIDRSAPIAWAGPHEDEPLTFEQLLRLCRLPYASTNELQAAGIPSSPHRNAVLWQAERDKASSRYYGRSSEVPDISWDQHVSVA